MPIISQFYGIIVRMFFKDTQKHHQEHVHVEYNSYTVVYSIKSCELLEGNISKKQNDLCLDGNT